MHTDIYKSKAQQHSRLLIPFVHIHACMCMQYTCTHIQCTLVFIQAKSMCMPHLGTSNLPHMSSSQDCGGAHAHGLQTFGAYRMYAHADMCRVNTYTQVCIHVVHTHIFVWTQTCIVCTTFAHTHMFGMNIYIHVCIHVTHTQMFRFVRDACVCYSCVHIHIYAYIQMHANVYVSLNMFECLFLAHTHTLSLTP